MDQKSWLWKKRSTEKTLIADRASNSSKKCEDEATEVQKIVTENKNLERELQTLNEKLSFALSERDAKDSIAKKQVKIAEEAIEGWEKAESEALSLKQELDKVSQQKSASEQRTNQLDAALKECMHQLRLVREEQEKKVHNAVIKSSEQFKKINVALESENMQLIKALSAMENTIADFNALRSRVDATEKENASLKYEIRVVEKELDIRNEEVEFNRRMNNTISKQLNESSKKISRLETECQSLRLLVRKRLPGPTTLGKMRSEVKSLEKDRIETMRRKKSNLSPTNSNAAFSDVGSDESWASALITEPEHKLLRISEMNLMDDFAEMEKLAVYNNNNNDISKAENVSLSIQKVLDLLEGIINIQSQDNGYTVRVFQWKTDELSDVLQKFILTCNDLLNGTGNLENFAQEVANNLEWVLNHCFSIRDVSSMKDAIVTRLGWDEWRSESEVDGGWANKESEIVRCESKDVVEDVGTGMEAVKQSESKIGNEIEKPMLVKEDEFRKACQRILDLENELENKKNSCERLEETCHGLKMELKSMVSKEDPDNNGKHWEKQLQNDWEITAASEKLTECQQTIHNLGKQLKALASPGDASLFDKVISNSTPVDSVITSSSTPRRNMSRRSSLLNKMAAEDNFQIVVSNKTVNNTLTGNDDSGSVCANEETGISSKFVNENGIIDYKDKSGIISSMDIVPSKKNGGRGFFKKMFWQQRKGNSHKNILLIGCN